MRIGQPKNAKMAGFTGQRRRKKEKTKETILPYGQPALSNTCSGVIPLSRK
jgi:hypothetical protein